MPVIKVIARGGTDIYSFELREDVRPYKTLWVKGQVFDKKTTKGLPSTVELIDLSTKASDFKECRRMKTENTWSHYLLEKIMHST